MNNSLARPSLNEPAPGIDLFDAGGKPWRLEDQRGRSVVLIFHRHIH